MFPHGLYFAGDYSTIPSENLIKQNVTLEDSTDYYAIGDKSLKITGTATSSFVRFVYPITSAEIGKSISAILKIFSKNHDGNVYLNAFNSSNQSLINRSVSYSVDSETSVSFSEVTIPDETSYIALTVNFSAGVDSIRYVDKIFLTIQ